MKATKEQVQEWKQYTEYGSVSEISRVTGLNRLTVMNILKGEKARLCNFVKVYNYFKKLKARVKRYNNID